ncbi:MAG: DAK2 domain-containing protein [Pyramidobacter sp.]|nr:DAK2 domain-containing protein [Pyramidobacter sp.]MBP3752582.1 DAK2 domain-containing protein [Pyramidobacter sp.]
MDSQKLKTVWHKISEKIAANKDYLTELDQALGDGDLGVSMVHGFEAVDQAFSQSQEQDLGKLLLAGSKAFNGAAPSSLGTIISLGMMGLASALKGKAEATFDDLADAFGKSLDKIVQRTGTKTGEKTMIDAYLPACEALKAHAGATAEEGFKAAAEAARAGSEATKQMVAAHGRAAYYGEKSLGHFDGGSVVVKLVFETIAESCE